MMKSQFRFVFVIFYLTAVLIFTVYLRTSDNQLFYQLCSINSEQSKLKQVLWQKQLRVEKYINPAAVSERIKNEQDTGRLKN